MEGLREEDILILLETVNKLLDDKGVMEEDAIEFMDSFMEMKKEEKRLEDEKERWAGEGEEREEEEEVGSGDDEEEGDY